MARSASNQGKIGVQMRYFAVPVPEGTNPDTNELWLQAVQQIARDRGITLTNAARGAAEPHGLIKLEAGSGRPPSPRRCARADEFLDAMRQLRMWAGEPSLRELEMQANHLGLELSRSTLARVLAHSNEHLPRHRTLKGFVFACGAGRFWEEWWWTCNRIRFEDPRRWNHRW